MNKNGFPLASKLQAEAYDSDEFKKWNETAYTDVQIIQNWCKMGLYFVIPGGNLDILMVNVCLELGGYCDCQMIMKHMA